MLNADRVVREKRERVLFLIYMSVLMEGGTALRRHRAESSQMDVWSQKVSFYLVCFIIPRTVNQEFKNTV